VILKREKYRMRTIPLQTIRSTGELYRRQKVILSLSVHCLERWRGRDVNKSTDPCAKALLRLHQSGVEGMIAALG
jgi:hypothetical protein